MNTKLSARLALGFSVLILVAASSSPGAAPVRAASDEPDVAAIYKAKCSMCHQASATKLFDVTKSDEHHVQAILKGQKGEKPPFMPAFETKGIDEAQARALVVYMRKLRSE